jgi:hypothetical protein
MSLDNEPLDNEPLDNERYEQSIAETHRDGT